MRRPPTSDRCPRVAGPSLIPVAVTILATLGLALPAVAQPPGPPGPTPNLQARVDALEVLVADQATQIAALQAENAAQDTRLALLEAETAAQDARIAGLENGAALLASALYVDAAGDVVVEGANLRILNGSGSSNGAANGTGNLVIGYDEKNGTDVRIGSHNLVIGPLHSYDGVGGLVAGQNNEVSGVSSVVLGGVGNRAVGFQSVVVGGRVNWATGNGASILGGQQNLATGQDSTVAGGIRGAASAPFSTVGGGRDNHASGTYSSVTGGAENTAPALYASVAGGEGNIASGTGSAILGGTRNRANGRWSSVSGGFDCTRLLEGQWGAGGLLPSLAVFPLGVTSPVLLCP